MGEAATIGLDIAKSIFQAHGADAAGGVVFRKKLSRSRLLAFFTAQSPCAGKLVVVARRYDDLGPMRSGDLQSEERDASCSLDETVAGFKAPESYAGIFSGIDNVSKRMLRVRAPKSHNGRPEPSGWPFGVVALTLIPLRSIRPAQPDGVAVAPCVAFGR